MLTVLATAAESGDHAVTAATGGLGALGLDWKALLFQVINFAVVLVVLRLVAYRPILKILEARRQRIEESLKNATAIEAARKALTQKQAEILEQSQQQAQVLIAKSQKRAEEILAQAKTEAGEKAKQILDQAQAQLTQELKEAKADLKQEAAALIAAATERILQKKLDQKSDAELIKRTLAEIKL